MYKGPKPLLKSYFEPINIGNGGWETLRFEDGRFATFRRAKIKKAKHKTRSSAAYKKARKPKK